MNLEPRPVTAADAEAVAALMTRISLDHPTGFELAASEVVELLADYPDGALVSEMAASLGRSVGELFRIVIVMERLGCARA